MAQAGDVAFRPHDREHGADLRPRIPGHNATSCTTTTVSCKRKAPASHPEAPPAARRQAFNEDYDALARLAGQIECVGATAAKSSEEPVKLDGGSGASKTNHGTPCAEIGDILLYGDRPESKNGGGTTALPIVIDDDDLPFSEEPEPAAATWCGDNTLVSPFGYTTWDPTDGGRYELLSTYTPPQCLDADEEDALWWLAAVYTSPELYTSPDNVFWGTPDGVWATY